MKIGISSPAFPLEPFSETLEMVSKEFSLWEIVADLNQLLPDIADDFRQYSPSYDLAFSIHAPFNDLNLASLNPKLRKLAMEYVKDSIATAAALGITLVSFHPGHLSPSGVYKTDKVLEANSKSLREIAKFSEEYSITLALENMPMKNWTLGNTAQEISEMIGNLPLGMCFDIGHAFIQNEVEDFLGHIDRIYNVHIHDNNGRRDEHLVLGEGAIDIPNILTKLNSKYNGNIIIESNNLPEGIESKRYLEKL
ncbi:sugar phosphate isomerase/epimerase family protein [[Eubacterium] cellulosolvens]